MEFSDIISDSNDYDDVITGIEGKRFADHRPDLSFDAIADYGIPVLFGNGDAYTGFALFVFAVVYDVILAFNGGRGSDDFIEFPMLQYPILAFHRDGN